MTDQHESNSLAYHLGAFFGHIARAVKTDVSKPQGAGSGLGPEVAPGVGLVGHVVRTHVDEATVQTTQGEVTLRRTVIDEVRPPEGVS